MPSIEDLVLRIQTIGGRTAAAEMETVGKATKGVGSTAKTVAGVAGIGALAFGLKDMTEAAIKWQQQQANLAGSLKNMGQLSAENIKKVNDAAETLATTGGFDPATSIQGITRLVIAHEKVGEAIKNNVLATDIARRSNISYQTAIKILSVVEQGRTSGLTRMGIVIPPVTAAVDKLRESHKKLTPEMMAVAKAQDQQATKAKIMTELWKRYGGATAQYSKTTAGAASNFRNQIDILGQKLGTFLLPIIGKLIKVLTSVATYFTKNKTAAHDLIIALAILAGLWGVSKIVAFVGWLGTLASTLGIVTAAEGAFAIASAIMAGEEVTAAAAMSALAVASGVLAAALTLIEIGTVVGAVALLAAGIYMLITHFKEVSTWVRQHWKPIVAVLVAPFLALAVAATGTFLAVKFAVTTVWSWIKGAWHTIEPVLVKPFVALRNVVVNLWNWVFKPFVDFVKGPFLAIVGVFKTIGGVVGSVFAAGGTAAFGAVKFVWNTILKPFASFIASTAAGGFSIIVSVVKTIGDAFNAAFNVIKTVVNFVKDNVLKPFLEFVGTMLSPIEAVLKTITDLANKITDTQGGFQTSNVTGPTTIPTPFGRTLTPAGQPGNRGATGGYTTGGPYTVGERGMEHVYLPPASLIIPNHFLRPEGGDHGGQPLENHLTFAVGTQEFARAVRYSLTKSKAVS